MCLVRALALHIHGNQQLEEETSYLINLFINKMDGLSADQFQGVHIEIIFWLKICLLSTFCCMIYILLMGTLSEKLLDELYWITKILCDCWDKTTTYATWTTLMQFSNLFAALIITLFQQNIELGETFNNMQWTNQKCISEERISSPRDSVI